MTDTERREAARQFYYKWRDKGREDEDDRSYWIDFLQNIMGVERVTDRIEFQKKVVGPDGNTKRIDAYIPETRVLIEQKSLNIDLDKPQHGHDGMTPYQQAKMYDNSLPVSEKAKWIVLSNFAEIWVYDMDTRVPEPLKFKLDEIPSRYSQFEFLVNKEQQTITEEMEISVKAGEFVGLIYDALLKQYIDPENEDSLKSLNMLCVRLVFCLYAEDAHIFGDNGHMFHDYMEQFETRDMRKALIELFKILDTPEDKRDPYDTGDLSKFPYVNGGLFAQEDIEIPNFTDEIRTILLAKASEGFDWSMISPTIFGAVFESTLNPETRRSGGMHYTSIDNIHKVIDPLFLDELKAELEEIKQIQVANTKTKKLNAFQEKLSKLTWLDPACGSGNFLTETYLSVRRLENEILQILHQGQISFVADLSESPIQVGINQFYGIEINDFAVTVAKTALWIAESQMLKETEDILYMHIDFLPLKTNANIIEGNALQLDWDNIIHKEQLNYIMGNPPFLGYKLQSPAQKSDLIPLFGNVKTIDYVAGWYYKAAEYINVTQIRCAFVSTNSITQGEQVPAIWKTLIEKFNVEIDFAYRTFIWDSEASNKAHVHCVIIGFSNAKQMFNGCKIYIGEDVKPAERINPYLLDADNIFIEKRAKPICEAETMVYGSEPREGGYLILSEQEKEELIKETPTANNFIKRFVSSEDFINNKVRYCLWLTEEDLVNVRSSKIIMDRLKKCREFREKSKQTQAHNAASTPYLFASPRQPKTDYLLIPVVSSGARVYIPIGYVSKDVIASNACFTISNASLYTFGVLTSNVHMAWMKTVCGRLKSDYRYSNSIVYNNFPWADPTDEQKELIERTAQHILDVREKYNKSTLADLYDPVIMPRDLQKAHIENDKAVMKAYGFPIKETTPESCVESLMKLYQIKLGKEKV